MAISSSLCPLVAPIFDDFEILDEDDETIYKETVKTSRFGVATVSWQIPANIKLGKYRLEVENDDGDSIGVSEFKITRYDLPNFSVNAKTDKTFYLPEQKTAEISVGADYLFGKPVTKGKVRVVEETERRWSYNAQKWEIEEAKSYEGVLNQAGKFIAQIDLSQAHENLRGDNWKRFEDLHFAAYFTDVSTNRTEQKRFDIRLTKEAIHIYFIRHDSDVNPKLPFQFYVSTFFFMNQKNLFDAIEQSVEQDDFAKRFARLPRFHSPSQALRRNAVFERLIERLYHHAQRFGNRFAEHRTDDGKKCFG